jgi:hypothetical protein
LPTSTVAPTAEVVLVDRETPVADIESDPRVIARRAALAESLTQDPPVIRLSQGLDVDQATAQTIALTDARVLRDFRDPAGGAALLNEVFGIYPLRASDINEATLECQQLRCFRVEVYHFASNSTTAAVVDVDGGRVIAVGYFPTTQPDVPVHIAELARAIAARSPLVREELGVTPAEADALMANTKTALNDSRCERTQHLCLAPTFVRDGRALWAIVDITNLNLVGTRWTEVGESSSPPVTERQLQDEVVMDQFCNRETALERDGWGLNYTLTSSDGLRISNVTFNGTPILRDAKLVDWHVNYSNTDGFGYSDAVGCPLFSQAAVVAYEPPEVLELEEDGQAVGFSLRQHFSSDAWPAPCNYYYEQQYDFYQDGRFRIQAISVGRGCGDDGTYRPVTRIAFAGDDLTFSQWTGSDWRPWTEEQWALQEDGAFTPEGYQYRLVNGQGAGYFLEPSTGQFGDGGRGDNAWVYLTRFKPDVEEGQADLITIGSCCNLDYRQGPEKFIGPDPDPVESAPLVVWYVAQLENDGRPGSEYCWAQSVAEDGLFAVREYPCVSGPMFIPIRP